MEVIIGFIGALIKIAILSSIYAILTLWIFKLIGRLTPINWFQKVSKNQLQFWFRSGVIYSIGLFCYLFTYWGFHGFGDGPRIPIGYGVIMDNTNWDEYGYIPNLETSDSMKIETTKFKIKGAKLVGNLESGFYDYKNSFFVYDLEKKKLKEFKTLQDYESFALRNQLPLQNKLRTFRENYYDYWSGWRYWLLP